MGAQYEQSETFRSAEVAARTFYEENAAFFEAIPDPTEGIIAWMSAFDVRVGRRPRSLAQTSGGRRILANRPAGMIRSALRYVFAQAEGARWADVDWDQVQRLEAALQPHYDSLSAEHAFPRLVWMPIAAARGLSEVAVDDEGEYESLQAQRDLKLAIAELEEAYDETEDDLPEALDLFALRKLAGWKRWVRRGRLPTSAQCVGGVIPDYASFAAELRALAARLYEQATASAVKVAELKGEFGDAHLPDPEEPPENEE